MGPLTQEIKDNEDCIHVVDFRRPLPKSTVMLSHICSGISSVVVVTSKVRGGNISPSGRRHTLAPSIELVLSSRARRNLVLSAHSYVLQTGTIYALVFK